MNGSNPSAETPFLACIFPGYPISTHFTVVDSKHLLIDIPPPAFKLSQFCISLLNPAFIPQGYGLAVYFCSKSTMTQSGHLRPSTNSGWQYIGSVTTENISVIFDAPWSFLPEFSDVAEVQLGISLEDLTFLQNLEPASSSALPQNSQRMLSSVTSMAMGIAKHVFHFITSFGHSLQELQQSGWQNFQGPANQSLILIPSNVLDRWFEKLYRKLEMDPHFIRRICQ